MSGLRSGIVQVREPSRQCCQRSLPRQPRRGPCRVQAMKAAPEKFKYNTQLSRARAYFRLGKVTRSLSDCSEVLGSQDAGLHASAGQLKG